MELEKIKLEFEDAEINQLIHVLNRLHVNQQRDFATLCHTIYKIDHWFEDNPDCLLKAKECPDYYNKKELFKVLGFKRRQVDKYCQCYQKFVTLADVGSKLKEPFVSFTSSKLFELLPLGTEKLVEFINNGQLSAEMTVKEIREFLKSVDEKETLDEEPEDEKTNTSEEDYFLVLKNDTMRKDFLENYKTWGLWFEEPRLKLKYYRCRIGKEILVAVRSFIKSYSSDNDFENVTFSYLNTAGSLVVGFSMGYSEIFAEMKKVSDKKVYLFERC